MADAVRRLSIRLSLVDGGIVERQLRDVGRAGDESLGRIRDSAQGASRALDLLDFARRVAGALALGQAGMRVDVQAMDFATMAARRAIKRRPGEGGWDIGLTFWNGLGASDPVGNVPMQASCDRAWPGWPCDAEHQALIDAYPYASTEAERKRLLDEIHESAYRVLPYVPFGQWFLPVALSPRLSGVLGMPGIIVLWNLEKAPRSGGQKARGGKRRLGKRRLRRGIPPESSMRSLMLSQAREVSERLAAAASSRSPDTLPERLDGAHDLHDGWRENCAYGNDREH